MCLDAGAQGAREGRGGRWLSTPASYSSARGLGEAGGGACGPNQEPAAASRALVDTGKACDWPAAALCKRAEGMEFLGPGLQ